MSWSMAFHIIPGTTLQSPLVMIYPTKAQHGDKALCQVNFIMQCPVKPRRLFLYMVILLLNFQYTSLPGDCSLCGACAMNWAKLCGFSRFSHGVLHLHVNDAASKSSSVQPCQFNMPVIEFHVVVKVQCNTAVQPLESVK